MNNVLQLGLLQFHWNDLMLEKFSMRRKTLSQTFSSNFSSLCKIDKRLVPFLQLPFRSKSFIIIKRIFNPAA